MTRISLILPVLLILISCAKKPQDPSSPAGHAHGIIPMPASVIVNEGNLLIDTGIVIVDNESFPEAINVIGKSLEDIFNRPVSAADDAPGKVCIQFVQDNGLQSEEYGIEVSGDGIKVSASGSQGAFYAAQSLRQLFWNATSGQKCSSFQVRQMLVKDRPQFAWRGFHLDVSRHFFSKDYILRIIDWLAYYKLNRLHLHLADDQGWRAQIDQYPLLTSIGAWRTFNELDSECMQLAKTNSDYNLDPRFITQQDGQTVYGGYYTKQDIQDIVSYAQENFIEVVPEIDMPGHMMAAIRSYPQLSCVDSAGWGEEFSVPVCPCKQEVMDFIFNTWDEVADLFPSPYVHIGCDEVDMTTWADSQDCQAFMQDHGLHSTREIMDFFIKSLQEHLQARGKKVIAWDDVNDGQVDSSLLIMYWRDWIQDSPQKSAQNGNYLVLTPATPFYLASSNTDEDLQDLYYYNPENIFSQSVMDKVTGLQSCTWTEITPSERAFEQVAFPRMQALSEVCWSPGRDWLSFQIRMKSHFSFMQAQSIHYRHPGW
jgi:hexosaminidase